MFAKLVAEIGASGLAQDRRFKTNHDRCQNVHHLTPLIEAALAAKTVNHWLAQLEASGIPCGPINNVEQVITDPHVLSRNMVVETDDPIVGTLKMAGNPIKMSGFEDPETRGPVPDLDGHRTHVLRSLKKS